MAERSYDPPKLVVDNDPKLEDNAPGAPLNSGGGGGTFDGMGPLEPRVAILEKQFERIDRKLDTLVTDVAEIKGQLRAMPTTLQLLGFIIAVLAIAGLSKYFAP